MVVNKLPTRIIKYPDPRLRRKCAAIEVFDESVAALARRMLELMHAGKGVGLAGPQVGVCRCIITCNPTGEPADNMVLINPEITDLIGAAEAEEGCLSVPDVLVKVRRARKCRIKAYDVDGKPFTRQAEDLLARIWQHELEHLDGRLIVDRMNDTDRIAYKKRLADLEAEYRRNNHRKR
jgi:peptide deformylase